MKRTAPIDLKTLAKADVQKLAAALKGEAPADWSQQFAASGKPRPCPGLRR